MQGEIAYRSHMVSFKKSFLLMGKLFCSTVFAQISDRRQKKNGKQVLSGMRSKISDKRIGE